MLSPPRTYAKCLHVVDLTTLKDIEHQVCPCQSTLGRWGRTQFLTQMCYETVAAMQASDVSESVFETAIDVRFNGFITGRNYDLVAQVFLLMPYCPLKLRFVGFRADSLALKNLFYVLQNLNQFRSWRWCTTSPWKQHTWRCCCPGWTSPRCSL